MSLSVRWNDVPFVVHLDPSTTGHTTKDTLIKPYNAVCVAKDHGEEEVASEIILDAIVEAGRPTSHQLAPCPVTTTTRTSATSDLHTLLLPGTYTFWFRTLDGMARLVPQTKQP